jgi:hypothetical protein
VEDDDGGGGGGDAESECFTSVHFERPVVLDVVLATVRLPYLLPLPLPLLPPLLLLLLLLVLPEPRSYLLLFGRSAAGASRIERLRHSGVSSERASSAADSRRLRFDGDDEDEDKDGDEDVNEEDDDESCWSNEAAPRSERCVLRPLSLP